MAIINDWSKSIAKLVDASFDVSKSVAKHGTVLGDAREGFIRDILERFLPTNVVVGSGQIVDCNGSISKQIDLIIYRSDFPILRTLGSSDIYLIEGVISTVEIKSKLNKESLFEALENGKSVRNLQPSIVKETLDDFSRIVYKCKFDELHVFKKNSIMGMVLPPVYIFSYKGITRNSIKTFIAHLNEWHNDNTKGEGDITVMPEVIATEGCVALKNVNDYLKLGSPRKEELLDYINDIKEKTGIALTYEELLETCDLKTINYGLGAKCDAYPLQFLISSMLTTVCTRGGLQKLGDLPIAYSLMNYIQHDELAEKWVGVAPNINNITCPKSEFVEQMQFS
ncbi:hypothetical protein GBN26_09395 [Plesiomonas shigelloides]|uniref:DUF6602 domain-containing protein n=1 Tax=Plesiomonas shigelloides TaxID=703 RepID=UPI0012624F58|nr:DUF6602 domain-containing protein [Plesiomonas shigelloides]KAB7700808.1 hypothetical protein GBN26_09395 [Plesiomonas shigelloides]